MAGRRPRKPPGTGGTWRRSESLATPAITINNNPPMRASAIIGAGELGGALAHVLARIDLVSTIRLIDETGHVAEGKALDIMQAAPIEGFATVVCGSTDLTTAAGAALTLLAPPAGGSEWHGRGGLVLVQRSPPL